MAEYRTERNMRAVCSQLHAALAGRQPGLLARAERKIPIKRVVFDIMRETADDDAYRGLSLAYLNELTVETATTMIQELLRGDEDVQDEPRAPPEPIPLTVLSEPVARREEGAEPARLKPGTPAPPTDGDDPFFHAAATTFRPAAQKVMHCISIDGVDRDPRKYPSRYEMTSELEAPLRSVVKLQLDAVVVPQKDVGGVNSSYMILEVKEFAGAYSCNDSKVVRKAFSKVVPTKVYETGNGRKYCILTPISRDAKHFDPPLPSLSRLTISLLRPDGRPVKDDLDDRSVLRISFVNADGNFLVRLSRTAADVQIGDTIMFSGVSTGTVALDAFVNRPEGHESLINGVAEIGEAAPNVFDQVVIARAGERAANGEFVRDAAVYAAFDEGGVLDLEALALTDDRVSGGRVLNGSDQMSVTFHAKCTASVRHELDARI